MSRKDKVVMMERVSLGASLIGLLAAGLTQNFIFAALPLTLNASLGLLNRQRLEQKLKASENTLKALQLKAQNEDQMPELQRVEREFSQRLTELESGVTILQREELPVLQSEVLTMKRFVSLDGDLENLIQQKVGLAIEERFVILQKALPRDYQYDLVRGRKESRKVLIKALNEAETRLILICPWLQESAIDLEIKRLIESTLSRGVCIEIGWGYLGDLYEFGGRMSPQNFLNSKNTKLYNALPWLEQQAPHLKLKIMGTHEKILVCDRKFIMVGSHNFLTSGHGSDERELGILTNNPQIIEQVITEFDSVPNADSRKPDRPAPPLKKVIAVQQQKVDHN